MAWFSKIKTSRIYLGRSGDLAAEVTATAAELNTMDGITSTTAELNILDGVTSTAAELNILDGVTATAAELNNAADVSAKLVSATGDITLTSAHYGRIVHLADATGDTVTLPVASGTGGKITIVVSTTVTSNNHIIQAGDATDEFAGTIYAVDTDTSDTLAAYPAVAADDFDTITMDGSTTGGLQGDWFEFIDVAANVWCMVGHIRQTGTAADPLSSAVS